MSERSDEQVSEILARAVRLVEDLPDDLRQAAFTSAVHLLGDGVLAETSPPTTPKRRGSRLRQKESGRSGDTSDDPVEVLIRELDRTAYPGVMGANRVLERALYILQIADEEFEIDGLSPPQVAKVLTDKFRIRTTRQSVAQALDGASNLVDRIRGERGSYRYRLMAAGIDHLGKLESADE